MALFDYLSTRPYGMSMQPVPVQLQRSNMYKHARLTMREIPIRMTDCNKIFASKWISPQEIAFGTKCNQLKILNTTSHRQFSIPLLKRQKLKPEHRISDITGLSSNCGIHSIAVNPSETRLATGGEDPNDIAVYNLPQLDPVALGEGAHKDWMFCCSWLDDEFLVSGSRDDHLCLWHIDSDAPVAMDTVSDSFELPSYESMEPVVKRLCQTCDRIRAMTFNTHRDELAVISLNGYIHTWDVRLMKQTRSVKLVQCQETVTLSYSAEANYYANGSFQYLSMFDPRTLKLIQCQELKESETGIRSLVSSDKMLTMGTGKGLVQFYDLTACRFISCSCGVPCTLRAGRGILSGNSDSIPEVFNIPLSEYKHAVYTLSYDRSHSRLFAAGGPLHAQISGNYAAIWI